MEILIKLNKRLYKYANHHTLTSSEIDEICDVIANGILLPKGHGRLIDADRLESHDEYDGQGFTESVYKDDIDNLPTIIEADKERESE